MQPRGRVRPKQKGDAQVFVADFRCPSTGKRRQLEAPTEAAAWARITAALGEEEPGQPGTAPNTPAARGFTLKQAYKLTLEQRWASITTVENASRMAMQAIEFFGASTPIEEIGPLEVAAWTNHLRKGGNSPATIQYKLSVLKTMRATALRYGMVKALPELPPLPRFNNTRERIFSEQEIDAFFTYFRQTGNELMAHYFVFMVETGCRFSEGATLLRQNVHLDEDPSQCSITLVKTKNGKARTVPLTSLAASVVRKNLPARAKDLVFPVSYIKMRDRFRTAKAVLGIDDKQLTLHCCRHTCASRMASRGANLVQIMRWGGWNSLGSVQRYAHVDLASLQSVRDLLN